MPRHARVFWGSHQGIKRYELRWRPVRFDSVVLISASEGPPPAPMQFAMIPNRFVGDAVFRVQNISPRDGSVEFVVEVVWPDPLPLWTDVTLFDAADDIRPVVVSF
jgi:hypothetical protein